jgi:PAS domain S-box-containing protein
MPADGWSALFTSAFRQSRNPMVLVDADRRIVDANGAFLTLLGRGRATLVGEHIYRFIEGGPMNTPAQWQEVLSQGRFTGDTRLLHADGTRVRVQWAATTEMATGRRLVLFVTLNGSRWGPNLRRAPTDGEPPRALSAREREIVDRVAMGETGPEIAAELGIAAETVRTHVRNAMDKLGARSRAHLVAKALTSAPVQA